NSWGWQFTREKQGGSPMASLRIIADEAGSVAAEHTQQLQQAEEEVVDGNEQGDCGQNIVVFTAMDDGTGLIQNHSGGKQYEAGRNGQLKPAHLDEEAGNHSAEQDDETGHDETGQEAEVLAGHDRIGRQTEKHQGGHAERHGDDLAAIGQPEVHVEQRPKCVAHEAGEGEGQYERSEEHTSELQSRENLVCRLLLEKKKPN